MNKLTKASLWILKNCDTEAYAFGCIPEAYSRAQENGIRSEIDTIIDLSESYIAEYVEHGNPELERILGDVPFREFIELLYDIKDETYKSLLIC
jgi:hypothetical protein